jgi:hypothetical protein
VVDEAVQRCIALLDARLRLLQGSLDVDQGLTREAEELGRVVAARNR